jgi:hypothetical protein
LGQYSCSVWIGGCCTWGFRGTPLIAATAARGLVHGGSGGGYQDSEAHAVGC